MGIDVSQSPSLRGSGRFLDPERRRRLENQRLNPLHCGAVVASGAGREASRGADRVSIPFIAGQWSLLRPKGFARSWPQRLNPLHCGAVVASRRMAGVGRERSRQSQSPSLRGSGRFAGAAARVDVAQRIVSIPFIAGQWSLPRARSTRCGAGASSQSPSLRGSGRFGTSPDPDWIGRGVSIPFIAGQWSLPPRERVGAGAGEGVSIPFIAGQWSLPSPDPDWIGRGRPSQSPSLRGSGRFCPPKAGGVSETRSLNPLHCGAVVASYYVELGDPPPAEVSIPFIAGQWSLPFRSRRSS